VLWNNAFMVMVDDDDGAIVEVYFGMLRLFLEMVWFFTLLLSLVIQDKVVLAKVR
jgi:hypothetical protein